MIYIKVKWLHSFSDEPVWLYSELDDQRWEIRKVYIYADGRAEYAGPNGNNGSTKLGIEPVPSFEEIASDPQFLPEEIPTDEFERVWKEATAVTVQKIQPPQKPANRPPKA